MNIGLHIKGMQFSIMNMCMKKKGCLNSTHIWTEMDIADTMQKKVDCVVLPVTRESIFPMLESALIKNLFHCYISFKLYYINNNFIL